MNDTLYYYVYYILCLFFKLHFNCVYVRWRFQHCHGTGLSLHGNSGAIVHSA